MTARSLRSHQRRLAGAVSAIAAGHTDARDILAAVTACGGKSLLPVLAVARLIEARIFGRVVLPVTFGVLEWRGALARRGRQGGWGRTAWQRTIPMRPPVPRCSRHCAPASRRCCCGRRSWPSRQLRAQRRQERSLVADAAARGAGKLVVVAPDQDEAKRYLSIIRCWMPPAQATRWRSSRPLTCPARRRCWLRPEPSILVTLAMAYEGLDVPNQLRCRTGMKPHSATGGGCNKGYPNVRRLISQGRWSASVLSHV